MLTKRLFFNWVAIAAFITSLSACHYDEVYHTSAVLPLEWGTADTLFFPLDVDSCPQGLVHIVPGQEYKLSMGVRHTRDYPYRELPIRLIYMVQNDSTGRILPLKGWNISCPLTDQRGFFDGGYWGSLFQKEFYVSGLTLQFPVSGHYVLAIVPLCIDGPFPGLTSLDWQIDP